jgi:hypothetical protein
MNNRFSRAIIVNFIPYLALLSISLTYIFIVEQQLWRVSVQSSLNGVTIYGTCYLQSNYYSNNNICNYAYLLGSATIFTSLIVSIISCCSSRINSTVIFSIFAFISFIWWVIGASLMTQSINDANNNNVPQEYWRQVILALSWTQVCLSFIYIFTNLYLLKLYSKLQRDNQIEMSINPQVVIGTPVYPPQYQQYNTPVTSQI